MLSTRRPDRIDLLLRRCVRGCRIKQHACNGSQIQRLRDRTSPSTRVCGQCLWKWVRLHADNAEPNGFDQAIQDALVSATHALGRVFMTHAQDYR